MKILTWNCGGAFRNKFEPVKMLDPDVWVIQECENPTSVHPRHAEYHDYCQNHLWCGENQSKGLAIFSKPSVKLTRLPLNDRYRDRQLKWFLPAQIDDETNLLAVWNHQNDASAFAYIGQLWLFMQNNTLGDFIIAGDFNSNRIWDKWDRWWNHSDVVHDLSLLGISSAYHALHHVEQGKEPTPTFFMHKKAEKPYHIDYIFCPAPRLAGSTLSIGEYANWITYSDHMPVILEIPVDFSSLES